MQGTTEYDDDGNLIHESFSDGLEYWADEKGQFFHENGSDNEESWWYEPKIRRCEYDKKRISPV